MKKRFCLVFILVLCCFVPTTLFAESNDAYNLTITCPTSDMDVSLYHVADDDLKLTDAFFSYSIDLNQSTESGWQGVANVLENHILMDGIKEDALASSKSSGEASFNGLDSGIYLIIAGEIEKDGVYYNPQVSLISLSGDLSVNLKYETSNKPVLTSTNLHVLKVWKNDSKKKRPTSIEVSLLKTDDSGNSVVSDKQVLSSDNQWSYTWDNLSSLYKYSVLETQVPSGYTESLIREENTVVLTNTASHKDKPVVNKNEKELPLTGQLWWPVPVLLLVGLVLFGLGRHLRNEK